MTTTGSIRVVSKRKGGVMPTSFETVIDVDRTNPILGNRFVLKNHRDEEDRTRVISLYDKELDEDLAENGPKSRELDRVADMVRAGAKVAFRCWCKPRRCHGDRLARIVAERAGVAITEQVQVQTWQQQLL